jgi:phage tail-like protein
MAARSDPINNYNFKIEIEGIQVGGFSEASGLESSIETIEYREGGDNTTVRKLPGKTTYADIVLKRGTTGGDNTLYEWHRQTVLGRIERKSGSIIVCDRAGREELRYNFVNAWPMKWDPADLNAASKEVAIEGITLAHEGVELA